MKWRRPGRALLVSLASAALLIGFAASASAQPDPPPDIPAPAPGVTPTVLAEPGDPGYSFLYTATDHTLWVQGGGLEGGPADPYLETGRLIGEAAPLSIGTDNVWTFGRGTDNQLWYEHSVPQYNSPWYPLGGSLTSKPGVASLGGNSWAVFVRGTDGALWERLYDGSAWGSWTRLGGQILAGTGPSAAFIGGRLYVAVVGTNRQVYVRAVQASVFFVSIGGQTTADPALTPISAGAVAVLAVFCRGTNGAGYYTSFTMDGAGPWRSMGGKLTTGVSAATATVSGQITTYTAGLGTSNGEYADVGTWASGTPTFSGWKG
jgi:alpha-galactosidase